MIALQGYLQTRRYEDKDGNKRTAYDVVANNVEFCGGKNEKCKGSFSRMATAKQTGDGGVCFKPVESCD